MKRIRIDEIENRGWLPNSRKAASRRFIVRHCGNAHPHICNYFIERHGFSDLCRLNRDPRARVKTKLDHFRDVVVDLFYVLRKLRQIRNAKEIIAIGPMAVNIAFLLKLGFLPSCQRLYWFGLFIHSPQWLRILRFEFRILDSSKIHYVIFSNFEKRLYSKFLLLRENKMYYVPYGDISEQILHLDTEVSKETSLNEGEFFFSGGYSNRDYLPLIEVFKTLPYKLVIVCSKLNTEVDESTLPPNIKVLRDLPPEFFDEYMKASKACIIPIKNNTGAAGQSCLLRYMMNRKIIIATDTGIIREYITDGVSGILVKDNQKAMAKAVSLVNANIDSYKSYADTAYERFYNVFSGEAITRRLDEMINQIK